MDLMYIGREQGFVKGEELICLSPYFFGWLQKFDGWL